MHCSEVFRDILSDPHLSTGENQPILIEQPADIVELFLHLVGDAKPLPADLKLDTALEICRLVQQYHCESAKRRIRTGILTDGKMPDWDIFILASYMDDPALAQSAVERGGRRLTSSWDEKGRDPEARYLKAYHLASARVLFSHSCSECTLCRYHWSLRYMADGATTETEESRKIASFFAAILKRV